MIFSQFFFLVTPKPADYDFLALIWSLFSLWAFEYFSSTLSARVFMSLNEVLQIFFIQQTWVCSILNPTQGFQTECTLWTQCWTPEQMHNRSFLSEPGHVRDNPLYYSFRVNIFTYWTKENIDYVCIDRKKLG